MSGLFDPPKRTNKDSALSRAKVGPIKNRPIDTLDEVERQAYLLEATEAAEYIERLYGKNPEFLATVGDLVNRKGSRRMDGDE